MALSGNGRLQNHSGQKYGYQVDLYCNAFCIGAQAIRSTALCFCIRIFNAVKCIDTLEVSEASCAARSVKRTASDATSEGNIDFIFPIAAINIYTVLDKVELGWLSNNQQVGFYSQTENIVKIAMTIITSLSVVLLPAVSKLVNENRMDEVRREIQKAIQFTFYIGCPMTMGMITVAPVFIPWFLGKEFLPSIPMFQILSILVIIISLSQILGNSILLSMRYEKIYTISIVMSAVINLVLNFLLIPKFAAYGAIVATIASEVCVGAIQQTKSIRLLNIRYRDIGRQIINPTVAAIVMGGVLFFLEKKMHPSTIEVLGMIVTGGAIYAAVLLLLHDQFMKSILTPYISKLRRKN